MPPRVNLRSSAVKRIMQEAAELADPDTDGFVAAPLESDIFEWHCTLRGVRGTEYEGGLYHLRIVLPASYPMSAPDIVLLTPNGRFELGKKICIDGLTSFHAGSWQPAWGVRTAITGLRAFWTQEGEALSAIGALDVPKEERRRLAKLSRDWTCPTCGESNASLLPDPPEGSSKTETEAPVLKQPEFRVDGEGEDGEGEEPPRTTSPALDTHLAADGPANADTSPILPPDALVPDALERPTQTPSRQDTDPTQAILGTPSETVTQPPPPIVAPVASSATAAALAAAPTTSDTPSSPDAPSRYAPSPPTTAPSRALGPVPLEPTPTTPGPALRRRVGSPPPPAPGARPSPPGPAVTGRPSPGPAARPPGPAPGARPAAPGHGAVPARFTAPPPPAQRRPPFWLDALIGALVVLLLYLLTGKA